MSFFVVIPARYASERLPGKPLADIAGKPMIVRVAEAAARSNATEVVVATDDQRIADVVTAAGFEAEMTDTDHASGSDRIMEVVRARGWDEHSIVLNVQGDEPQIPAAVINQLAELLLSSPTLASATLCEPVQTLGTLLDPNVVKVVRTTDDRALYFSRAPIPFGRELFAEGVRLPAKDDVDEPLPATGVWWRHIGIYAYRCWALEKFVAAPVSMLENQERLEQLRLLENGREMRALEACEFVPPGIDTPDDLQRVREHFDA